MIPDDIMKKKKKRFSPDEGENLFSDQGKKESGNIGTRQNFNNDGINIGPVRENQPATKNQNARNAAIENELGASKSVSRAQQALSATRELGSAAAEIVAFDVAIRAGEKGLEKSSTSGNFAEFGPNSIESIPDAMSDSAHAVVTTVRGIENTVGSLAANAIQSEIDNPNQITNAIGSGLSTASSSIGSFISAEIEDPNRITNAIGSGIKSIPSTVGNIVNNLPNTAGNIGGALSSAGQKIAEVMTDPQYDISGIYSSNNRTYEG